MSLALLVLSAATAGSGPSLDIRGSCPGVLDISVDAASPDSKVAFAAAESSGLTLIPAGRCANTRLDLDTSTVSLLATPRTDTNGAVRLTRDVPQARCGLRVQVVDLSTCLVSNTACTSDADGDGICDLEDGCLGDDARGDSDADGVCDDLDLCFGDDGTGDADGDGWCADSDSCDDRPNPGQEDICDVWFVDAGASGAADGTSWSDAFQTIQDAVVRASDGQQIWVAEGVYGPGAANETVMTLIVDLSIYGGFSGVEWDVASRAGGAENTLVSGDFLANDDDTEASYDDNARPVASVSGGASVLLDGLTIAAGAAEGSEQGAGLRANGATLTASNLVIRDNRLYGTGDGGGLACIGSASCTVVDSLFVDNYSRQTGAGALALAGGQLVVRNSTFLGQTTPNTHGAAIMVLNGTSSAEITYSSFSSNSGRSVVRNVDGTLTVRNSTLYAGTEANSVISNGSTMITEYVCLDADLGGTNIHLDDSSAELSDPFVVAGERVLLSQTAAGEAFTSACVDMGDTADADEALPGWEAMTTRTDSGLDTADVDPARHYVP